MLTILIEGARELGLELTPEQVDQFQAYYETLVDWAERVSLTSVKDEEGVQRRHFLESAALIPIVQAEGFSWEGRSLVDVGSGTGVPGIPLKILVPSLKLTLVEAKQRKAEFLGDLLPKVGLTDVTVITRRAEEAGRHPHYREQYDFAVAKALAPLRTLLELTLPFVHMGGLVMAPKGKESEQEVKEAAVSLETLKGSVRGVFPLALAESGQSVVLVDKVLPTPMRFPRRPGIPAKRPL
ncbi:MAG: 16S rRNA (guanine(527)-N(7))-methyltransferase RsmG [Dehalococcoidia bacterium]